MISRRPRLALVGVAIVLLAFAAASIRLAQRSHGARQEAGGGVTLRVGHFLLYDGVRGAFDAIAREYERAHPGIRIESVPVPMRQWIPWQRTQLVGGTAPDIMQLGRGTTEELVARFYLPLSPHVESPNPHNAGTPLGSVPWRATFVDGLSSNQATYFANLGECYGVPTAVNTLRVLLNRDLLQELTGRRELPGTLEEFVALCAEATRAARARGRPIVAIASSGEYAGFLFEELFRTQTQRLLPALHPGRSMRADPRETSVALLRNAWSYDSPEVREGLGIVRDVAAHLQPGFLQLDREDALFPFLQGRALMLFTGSWDYGAIAREARFPIEAFPLPPPAGEVRRRNMLGQFSEADRVPEWIFGITRACPHPEQALDFLRFLTSHGVARRFSEAGRFLTATVGLPPPEELAAFVPATEGAPSGFRFSFRSYGAEHARQLVFSQLHRLTAPDGSVEAFVEAIRPGIRLAVQRDLGAARRAAERDIRRFDSLVVLRRLAGPEGPATAPLDALLSNQTMRELQQLQDADVAR